MEFGQIIGWLQNEWAALSSAPVTFITVIGITFLVSGRIWKWYYEKQIKDRDARHELLLEQLRTMEIIHHAERLNRDVDDEIYAALARRAESKSEESES